ncbi:MAG: flagellar basal body P-ring protein FlgI [Phycisphaerales bacterium]
MRTPLLALAFLLSLTISAHALTVKELTTIRGTGQTTLWGWGLVMGLPGTGDSGDYLPMARQIARLLEEGGNVIPDIEELAGAQNIAVVMVTCTIPREGGRKGETYDVFVQAANNASSLEGGRLFITPLLGPLPGQGAYAFAEGAIAFEGDVRTTGRVRAGARLIGDIRMQTIDAGGRLTLHLNPEYAGWPNAKLLANTINQDRQGLLGDGEEVAYALDEKTVVVTLPEAELASPANFLGTILDIRLDPSLLSTPARVVVNERTGSIVLSGDVRISPAVISHEQLTVTTVTPAPEPTPDTPAITQSTSTAMSTEDDDRGLARASNLLDALERLDVPVADQIAILAQLHRGGLLHAEFVVE